jgi:hypothetical protein
LGVARRVAGPSRWTELVRPAGGANLEDRKRPAVHVRAVAVVLRREDTAGRHLRDAACPISTG